MIQVTAHEYSDGSNTFVGQLVRDAAQEGQSPGILMVPQFRGILDLEIDKAKLLAQLGYVVLIADYYGDGAVAKDFDEAGAWMSRLNNDREELRDRMVAALNALKALEQVDEYNVAAVGYCFGGKAVLDLARSGASFKAAVTFHAILDKPDFPIATFAPSVLVCHGWDDPSAKPDSVLAFAEEMTNKAADWHLLAFGHTGHAFTNPGANMPDAGLAYNEIADTRSWDAMIGFLAERIGGPG